MRAPGVSAYARLAGGTAVVAVGLAVAGAGTVGMLAAAARGLPAEPYASFAVWWTVATLLTFGLGVFEAYLARLVVTETSAGRSPALVTAELTGRALAAAGAVGLACVLLSPLLASAFFRGSRALALLLPVFVLVAAVQALLRGVATGRRCFGAVAGQLVTDGLLRGSLTVVVALSPWASPVLLAVATCIAAAISVIVGSRLSPGWWARPRLRGGVVPLRPLYLLAVGAVGPVLANSGSAPWLASAGHLPPLVVGAFVGALTLCRLPTQFLSAAFGPLLAELAHTVEARDEPAFRRLQRTADLVCLSACALFVAAVASVGPRLLRLYLGPQFRLPVLTLALLATTSGLLLASVVRQAGLAALDRWSTVAVAWVSGTVVLGLVLVLPLDPLLLASAGPAAAALVALVIMVASRPASRAWPVSVTHGQETSAAPASSRAGAELPPQAVPGGMSERPR